MSVCGCAPVETAKNVKTSVFSSIEIHAEDGREDEQHHGKVKHHHHCSLQETQQTVNAILRKKGFSKSDRRAENLKVKETELGLHKGGYTRLKSSGNKI